MPRYRQTWTAALALTAVVSASGSFLLSTPSQPQSKPAVATASPSRPALSSCLLEATIAQQWAAPTANAFSQDATGAGFYCNPLRLDGKPVNWQAFNVETRGTLSVVHGDPQSKDAASVAFEVSLHRHDQVLLAEKRAVAAQGVYGIDLAEVLANARPGDQLVIEPVGPADRSARRVIVLGC